MISFLLEIENYQTPHKQSLFSLELSAKTFDLDNITQQEICHEPLKSIPMQLKFEVQL